MPGLICVSVCVVAHASEILSLWAHSHLQLF